MGRVEQTQDQLSLISCVPMVHDRVLDSIISIIAELVDGAAYPVKHPLIMARTS